MQAQQLEVAEIIEQMNRKWDSMKHTIIDFIHKRKLFPKKEDFYNNCDYYAKA
jgi:hypothetical protein